MYPASREWAAVAAIRRVRRPQAQRRHAAMQVDEDVGHIVDLPPVKVHAHRSAAIGPKLLEDGEAGNDRILPLAVATALHFQASNELLHPQGQGLRRRARGHR